MTATFAEEPYEIVWSRQIGSAKADESQSIAVDVFGNAYIAGTTVGDLAGMYHGEDEDGFLAKYDALGSLLWSRQLGTAVWEVSNSVAVDLTGNSYITGVTSGNLAGTNLGGNDAYLIKHDPFGKLLWSRQIGTEFDDEGASVAVDSANNIYLSGNTEGSLGGANSGYVDTFLSQYDSSGNLLWSRQFGTYTADIVSAVVVDTSGNAYVTGHTLGDLVTTNAGYWDGFLYKFDTSGNQLWSRQFGTAWPDASNAVAVDYLGNAFVAGVTYGNLSGTIAGDPDASLHKFDESGNLLWSRQLGTPDRDGNISIAVDMAGAAYVLGYAPTGLVGTETGVSNSFLAKYDTHGTLLGVQHMSVSARDSGRSIAIGQDGSLFVTGTTGSTAISSDGSDAFVLKLAIPEPSSILLVSMACLAVACRRSR